MGDEYYDSQDEMFDHGFGGGIFQQLFSRHGNSSRQRNSRKTETTCLPFKLSLEDCFKGKKTKLMIKRKAICSKCNGLGGKSGACRKCSTCRGKGRVIRMQHVGPCMVQQTEGICEDCEGKGDIIADHDRCGECNGNKVVSVSKTVEVTFPRGSGQGTAVTLKGEGDESPGKEAGDIVIKVEVKPHDTYRCERGDLFMNKTLTITESICGLKFPVKRLDGSTFIVNINKMIRSDDVRFVKNEGMPSSDRSRGNLYISFIIEYPSDNFASTSSILTLKTYLNPGARKESLSGESNAVKVEMNEFVQQSRFTGGTISDDEDADNERQQFQGHQQSAQCSSQ